MTAPTPSAASSRPYPVESNRSLVATTGRSAHRALAGSAKSAERRRMRRTRRADATYRMPAEARCCSDLRPRHELGLYRLPGGSSSRRRRPQHEREAEEEPRVEKSQGRNDGQGDCDERADTGADDEQLAAVEGIRKHARGEREQHGRREARRLHQCDHRSSCRGIHQVPLGADRLHPGAHVGAQLRDPEHAEGRDAERRPGRDRARVSHVGYFFLTSVSPERAAMNASWGTSTRPTIFMRFFPSFCFSRSLRLRVMSPP